MNAVSNPPYLKMSSIPDNTDFVGSTLEVTHNITERNRIHHLNVIIRCNRTKQ